MTVNNPLAGEGVPPGDVRLSLSRHREAIARTMTLSAQIPQFGIYRDADMSRIALLRAETAGVRFSYSDVITAACARALRSHPHVNASFVDNEILQHGSVNIGLAYDAGDGLIVLVVREADRRSLGELASERRRLSTAADGARLRGEDIFGATFVISNLGPSGVRMFQALLVPPLVAIMAVGAITSDSSDTKRSDRNVTLCLTLDHRALDGVAGAAFLASVVESLEAPGDWLVPLAPKPSEGA
jgi:pyruvate dehydrogenase E2 component (dihydrolipoamide acetyltransferase)